MGTAGTHPAGVGDQPCLSQPTRLQTGRFPALQTPQGLSLGSQASHSQVPLDLLQIVVLPAEHAPQRGEHSQCISNAVPSVISFTMCQLARGIQPCGQPMLSLHICASNATSKALVSSHSTGACWPHVFQRGRPHPHTYTRRQHGLL